jgi:hypothetical protein
VQAIAQVANDGGWTCPDCRARPTSWWSTICSRCRVRTLACGACQSRESALAGARDHERACDASPRIAPALARPAARAGAKIGMQARGRGGALVGGAVGAALGALADRVLAKPEVQPAARLARALYDIAGDVRAHLIKKT